MAFACGRYARILVLFDPEDLDDGLATHMRAHYMALDKISTTQENQENKLEALKVLLLARTVKNEVVTYEAVLDAISRIDDGVRQKFTNSSVLCNRRSATIPA